MAATKQHTISYDRSRAMFRVSRLHRQVEVVIPSDQAGVPPLRQVLTYDPLTAEQLQLNIAAQGRGDVALPFVALAGALKTGWAALFDATIDEVFANAGVVEA